MQRTHPGAAAINGHPIGGRLQQETSTDSVLRLKHSHREPAGAEIPCGCQAGQAATDDQHIEAAFGHLGDVHDFDPALRLNVNGQVAPPVPMVVRRSKVKPWREGSIASIHVASNAHRIGVSCAASLATSTSW